MAIKHISMWLHSEKCDIHTGFTTTMKINETNMFSMLKSETPSLPVEAETAPAAC